VLPRGLRRGQENFRSHNSCLSLWASSSGRRRACVLFGVSFRGGYSPTGLPGDTAWLAFPSTGWGWLGVLSHCGYPNVLQYIFLQNELLRVQAWHDAWRLSFPKVRREHRLKDWYKIPPMTVDMLQWW